MANETVEDRINKRAPALLKIAEALVTDSALPEANIMLWPARIPLVARAYFILNETYKNWRIEDGHRTEEPKIAALQSMAIMSIPPFRPRDPTNVTTIAAARCNEIYALAAASSVIRTDIDRGTNNFYLRLLDVLSDARSETLEPFVVDIGLGIDQDFAHYVRTVHPSDKPMINSLITIFELLSGARK